MKTRIRCSREAPYVPPVDCCCDDLGALRLLRDLSLWLRRALQRHDVGLDRHTAPTAPPRQSLRRRSGWRWADQGVAYLGDQPLDDEVETEATVVRAIRQVPRPGNGHRVAPPDQRIDVIQDYTAPDLDGVLVVVAGTLRSMTRRVWP
jgi:hypothetical protein